MSSTAEEHEDIPPLLAVPLRDQVHRHLRQAILAGDMRTGDRISPADIARTLGVSTTPVRDALRTLEEEGLVETSPRRWTRVASPDRKLASEIYPLIAVLEEFAVSAIQDPDEALFGELEEANAAFNHAAAGGDVDGCIKANDAFHAALLEATGNTALQRVLTDLRNRVKVLDSQYFQSGAEESAEEHGQVIEALREGDAARAGAILRRQWVHWLPSWGDSPEPPAG